ncbi:MAG: glycogen/starch synthase, partial [Candidatus Hodarchaeota archaeon]
SFNLFKENRSFIGGFYITAPQRYKTSAFISFESEFSPGGGLAAVMRFLPREMVKKNQTILITPFFQNIELCYDAHYFTNRIRFNGLTAIVRYDYTEYPIRILEYIEYINSHKFKIYFIHSKDFFLASQDPYVNPGNESQLFEDACFFCASIPEVLKSIPEERPFLLHLQDWETALVTETMPSKGFHKCVLTLHNPYDHPLNQENMEKLHKLNVKQLGKSVLTQSLPKMAKISTVSQNFASDLINDPLLSKIYAPHLQKVFRQKQIIGIENGIFVRRSFPSPSDPETVYQVKNKLRTRFIHMMDTEIGQKMNRKTWGQCDFTNEALPLFLIFGRDDPRQKGYDLITEAIRKILEVKGDDYARFVFTPLPGQKGVQSLLFMKDLGEEFPRSVKIFPMRMSVGYMELQQATSYIIMPSLYEPFGGATEGYANGVPVIARATGGLVQQVDPYNYKDLPKSIKELIDKYHGLERHPTGFLFKEKTTKGIEEDWRLIINAEYLEKFPIGNPIKEHKKLPLFNAMVDAAIGAIKQATDLFTQDYETYVELIKNGLNLLEKFSWERAVDRYLQELYF